MAFAAPRVDPKVWLKMMLLMPKLYSFDQVRALLELLYKSFLNVREVVHFKIANNIV